MHTKNLDTKFGRKQLSWNERFTAVDAYAEEIRNSAN